MKQLTEHFTLEEFTATSHRSIDNSLPDHLWENAAKTCQMLERIRQLLTRTSGRDVPIHLSSGYRCIRLNRTIGSSDTSDHVQALAADWSAPRFGPPYVVASLLADYVDVLDIGQLIYEFGGWVHTSARRPNRSVNRIITINRSGTFVGIRS